VNDGGLVGRWDFSYGKLGENEGENPNANANFTVQSGVVLNQAANDAAAVTTATATLQAQLIALQIQIDVAQANLNAALASNADNIADLRSALAAAQLAVVQAKDPSSAVSGAISYGNILPSDASSFTTNLRASSGLAQGFYAVQEITTNTLNDLASIATQQDTDDDLYLRLAMDASNKLPFRSKNVNTQSNLQTSFPVPSTNVRNSASITDRIDGTIVQEGLGRKRDTSQGTVTRQNPPTCKSPPRATKLIAHPSLFFFFFFSPFSFPQWIWCAHGAMILTTLYIP
jgi:hypothetical protein